MLASLALTACHGLRGASLWLIGLRKCVFGPLRSLFVTQLLGLSAVYINACLHNQTLNRSFEIKLTGTHKRRENEASIKTNPTLKGGTAFEKAKGQARGRRGI